MRIILILLATIAALTGCASSSEYRNYLEAQLAANKQAVADQKPLVRLTTHPGQAITGLASLEVYMPPSTPVVQQSRPSEWAGVLGQGLSVVGTVLGIRYAGQAAIGLSDSVGRAGTAGYPYMQAPGTITTTTTNVGDNSGAGSGNSGRLAGGNVIDNTSPPTVVMQPAPVMQPPPVIVP